MNFSTFFYLGCQFKKWHIGGHPQVAPYFLA